ncbi:MAG: hypothetical protein QOJ81_2184 [Chloroflexota bacterium]|jgi:DNA-binding NarL/FixJ family response regulator|nr:hypothetical protein [Chloroflexota bacterium]
MTSPLAALTLQQLETLRVLRESGWLYKKAAVKLHVPEATVRSRVHQMLKRSGLPDRAELAYWLAASDAQAGKLMDIRSISERPF